MSSSTWLLRIIRFLLIKVGAHTHNVQCMRQNYSFIYLVRLTKSAHWMIASLLYLLMQLDSSYLCRRWNYSSRQWWLIYRYRRQMSFLFMERFYFIFYFSDLTYSILWFIIGKTLHLKNVRYNSKKRNYRVTTLFHRKIGDGFEIWLALTVTIWFFTIRKKILI